LVQVFEMYRPTQINTVFIQVSHETNKEPHTARESLVDQACSVPIS